jgi:hypothetical protein
VFGILKVMPQMLAANSSNAGECFDRESKEDEGDSEATQDCCKQRKSC